KAAVEALPVSVQLVNNGIQVDFGCKLCGAPETVTHVLRDCQFARNVWLQTPIGSQAHIHTVQIPDFLTQAASLVSLPLTGLHAASLQSWICWHLWTAHNNRVFSDRVFTEQEACGMGMVFNLNAGNQTSSFASSRRQVHSALAVEAWPLREALVVAMDRELDDIQFLSDSMTLVNVLKYQEIHTEIHAIVNNIRQLALYFSTISFVYVPQSPMSRRIVLQRMLFELF
ncbi:hypothetical protein EUTSA_v10023960mg, partial [Eutrema salsugineum]